MSRARRAVRIQSLFLLIKYADLWPFLVAVAVVIV